MNTVRKNEGEETLDFILKLIYGGQYMSPQKTKRINDFWSFCHSTFWPTESFSQEQVEEFKRLIADHFKGTDDINGKFKELIERAALVKRYLQRKAGRYIANPSDWFNIHFMFGLSGTARWYKELAFRRQIVPHYNQAIAHLANAILSYSKYRKSQEVVAYREAFIADNQTDLMQLYVNAIAFMDHINKSSQSKS